MNLNDFRMANPIIRNTFATYFYRHFKIDFVKPYNIYAQLTTKCNSKCNMCDVWRKKEEDIPKVHWINALRDLKSLIGTYKVNFSGGEVLLMDGVFEIFEFCYKKNILWGITTNGILLTPNNIKKLLSFKPYNIHISLDSLNYYTYQKIRGVPRLNIVKSNIDYLMRYKEKNNLAVKVTFKTVVNNFNLDELPSLAEYAMEKKVIGITYDPIRRRRKLFIEKRIPIFESMAKIDTKKLESTKKELLNLKKKGYRILNSEKNISQWFREDKFDKDFFCTVPLNSLYIDSQGNVSLCDFTDLKIGNIKNESMNTILQKSIIKSQKKLLTHCNKPCVYCVRRHFIDYFKLLKKYIKN